MSDKEFEFWGIVPDVRPDLGPDEWTGYDWGEIVGEYLDRLYQDDDPLPLKLTVRPGNWEPVNLSALDNGDIGERLFERIYDQSLSEEFSEITTEMRELERDFVAKFVELYRQKYGWTVQQVMGHDVVVDVRQWVEENEPEWITEGVKFEDASAAGGKETT